MKSARVTVRPLRIAIVVPVNDAEFFRLAIEFNTSVCGGKQNFLIPYSGTGDAVALSRSQKLMDLCQPDFVITIDGEIPFGLVFEKSRCISMDKVYSARNKWLPLLGTSMYEIFCYLYDSRFKYVYKHDNSANSLTLYRSQDPSLDLFYCTYFGVYSERMGADKYNLSNFATNRLGATVTDLPRNKFIRIATENRFPIEMTTEFTKVVKTELPVCNVIFVQESEIVDLIEAWNLRASGLSILMIPTSFLSNEVEDFFSTLDTFANKYGSPLRLFGASSLDETDLSEMLGNRPFLSVKNWTHVAPLSFHSYDTAVNLNIISERFWELKVPLPDFTSNWIPSGYDKAALIVNLGHGINGVEQGLVLPVGIADSDKLSKLFRKDAHVTSEGLVFLLNDRSDLVSFGVPETQDLFKVWLQKKGLRFELSGAGKTTRQMVSTLGDLREISWLAYPEVIKQFDKMASGTLEEQTNNSITESQRLRHHVEYSALKSLLMRCQSEKLSHLAGKALQAQSEVLVEKQLKKLTRFGVLRLGMAVTCSECGLENWYPFDEIKRKLECSLCLVKFRFPEGAPPNKPWSYRTQGVFSMSGCANGAYAAVLTLKFLTYAMRGCLTWTAGIELQPPGTDPIEVDLFVWWKPDLLLITKPSKLIICECKSFNALTEKDITRLKSLSKIFPEAIFIVSTMKPAFSEEEKGWLRDLITQDGLSLVVLTATELFSGSSPPRCWVNLPIFDQLRGTYLRNDFETLIAASSQVHLQAVSSI